MIVSNNELTQERLKEIIEYDKNTGIFKWKVNRGRNAKIGDIAGSKNGHGYMQIKISRKIYQSHRLAWLYEYGVLPEIGIDHINHNKEDNRIENLTIKNQQENCKNLSLVKNNTSGVCGVTYRKNVDKWVAQIGVDMEHIFLGIYENKEDAIKARKEAEMKYGFHKNHGKREVA